MAKPLFPEEGEKEAELEGESFEEWLLNRRGIAEGSSEAVWGGEVIFFTVGRGRQARVVFSTRPHRQLR